MTHQSDAFESTERSNMVSPLFAVQQLENLREQFDAERKTWYAERAQLVRRLNDKSDEASRLPSIERELNEAKSKLRSSLKNDRSHDRYPSPSHLRDKVVLYWREKLQASEAKVAELSRKVEQNEIDLHECRMRLIREKRGFGSREVLAVTETDRFLSMSPLQVDTSHATTQITDGDFVNEEIELLRDDLHSTRKQIVTLQERIVELEAVIEAKKQEAKPTDLPSQRQVGKAEERLRQKTPREQNGENTEQKVPLLALHDGAKMKQNRDETTSTVGTTRQTPRGASRSMTDLTSQPATGFCVQIPPCPQHDRFRVVIYTTDPTLSSELASKATQSIVAAAVRDALARVATTVPGPKVENKGQKPEHREVISAPAQKSHQRRRKGTFCCWSKSALKED